MPSKSGKQHRLMALVANDPKAAKRLGIPQKVGEEFMKADKGRKFGSGGSMKESKAMMKKEVSFMKKKGAPKSMIRHEEAEYGMKKGTKRMAGGGYAGTTMPGSPPPTGPTKPVGCPPGYMNVNGNCVAIDDFDQPPPIEPEEFERRIRGTREGMMGGRRMAKGGVAGSYRRAADGIASKGKTKGHVVKMAGGGVASSYRSAADGIASKGKTKGKMVKMMGGGYCG